MLGYIHDVQAWCSVRRSLKRFLDNILAEVVLGIDPVGNDSICDVLTRCRVL